MNETVDRPPRRSRRPDWKPRFLEVIKATGNVRLAAMAAGVSRTTPYIRAKRDPKFAADWAAAEQEAIDILEATARKLALEGNAALLMFLLRSLRPERYRESLELHVDVRREAERIAAKTGIPVDELLATAERRAKELP